MSERKAVSVGAWKKAAVHYPTMPSGAVVGIRVPDLAKMIVAGSIPQHLLEAAVGASRQQSSADSLTADDIIKNAREEAEFTDLVVKMTVVEPTVTDEDLDPVTGIPSEDRQFLVAIATRQRDLDAEGEHIGGLTKSEKFRRFRRLGEFESDVEDL